MTSHSYDNTVQDATYIDVDDVAAVALVQREGIGIRQVSGGGGTVEGTAWSFGWKGINESFVAEPDQYFVKISDLLNFPMTQRVVTVEIGPTVDENTTYTFLILLELASYTASSGDTDEDVRDALVTAINGASWSSSVTAVPISTNQIEVTTDDVVSVVTANLSASLYKAGHFVEFALNGGSIKQYLISFNQSGFTYPSPPSLDSSYLYDDLTLAPAGIESLLYTPGYVQDEFSQNAAGTTDVTDSPELSLPPAAGRCLYANAKIYFGLPYLNYGERILMLVT